MSLKIANAGGGDYERVPAGTTLGICYGLVDIGWQETNFGTKQQVIILWETPNELMKDGRPFGVSKVYTASMNEKAILRKDIQSWRGKAMSDEEADGFELNAVLGKACLLNITETQKGDRTYTNVGAVTPIMKGMTVPRCSNALVLYDMDAHDQGAYSQLPDWIRKKIDSGRACHNEGDGYRGDEQTSAASSGFVDDAGLDLPF